MNAPRILIVQNDPTDDIRRLGGWLTGAGAELITARPYDGEALPEDLTGFDALVVLGGAQHAYPVDGLPGSPWFPELETMLRGAVATGVPTLGVCLGGQLLAQACGGRVERSEKGLVVGPRLVAKRDVAERDALFGPVPFTPDVFQWHSDEITLLPPGGVLMVAAPSGTIEAFRVGQRAWGTQFHIECDLALLETWAGRNPALLDDLGIDAGTLLARSAAAMDDVEDVWRPFAERFVALCTGKLSSMFLPVIEA